MRTNGRNKLINSNNFIYFQVFSVCGLNPCMNGGSCLDGMNQSFSCLCTREFEGRTCETPGLIFAMFLIDFLHYGKNWFRVQSGKLVKHDIQHRVTIYEEAQSLTHLPRSR